MFKVPKITAPKKQAPTKEPFVFRPHAGQQTKYFKASVDIVIFGGGNGGGKTMSLLVDALSGVAYHNYQAALFRRTLEQHKMPGGLRSESLKLYSRVEGMGFNRTELKWTYHDDDNRAIKLLGCEGEGDEQKYDGMQVSFLGFDQLEQFTAQMFFFIISRQRSADCQAPKKIRATCNPEPGWLADFLKSGGYVDSEGWPVDALDGVVRYFIRDEDGQVTWRDKPEDFGDRLKTKRGPNLVPKSFTFIKALVYDNPTLMKNDPGYLANLQQMPLYERRKRLEGNWNAKASAGTIFRGAWWGLDNGRLPDVHPGICHAPPPSLARVRAWDIGWSETGDPSVGVRVGQDESGWYVDDAIRFRSREAVTLEVIKKIAEVDGTDVPIILPRDPGKGGIDQTMWALELGALGYEVHCINDKEWGDKIARCRYAAPQCELGHVKICTTHDSKEVALWLTTQETQLGSGRFIDCSTTQGWQQQLVEALDGLATDCPHFITDWTDAFSKGFNYLTQVGGVVASQVAYAATKPRSQAQRQLDKQLTPAWSRGGGQRNRRSFWE